MLHRVLDEEDEKELSELIEGRIVNIFYLFSQAENYVKEVVADRQVLKSKSQARLLSGGTDSADKLQASSRTSGA